MKSRPLHAAVQSVSFDSLESRRMFDATHLVIYAQPNDAVAGNTLGTIRVMLVDDANHVATTDSSSVTLAISDGTGADGASLTGTATVAASHGVATFTGISITAAADGYTLDASDGSLDSDTSDSFDVDAGEATALTFHQSPSDAKAGDVISPDEDVIVYAVDKYGNLADGDNGTVTMGISTGPAGEVLNGTVAVTADGGVATFDDLSLETVGDYKLGATQGKLTVASDTFSITNAAADHLAFVTMPKTATVLTQGDPIVANVLDAYGNLVKNFPGNVYLSVATGPGEGSAQRGTNVEGVVTWAGGYAVSRAGAYTLLLDGTNNVTSAISTPITYVPGAAAQLLVKVSPTTTAAGSALTLSVAITDQFSNIVTTDKSKVTVAINTDSSPDGSKLTGATTATPVNGVATFANLSLSAAGSYLLDLTDGNLAGTSTNSIFRITPAAPAKLVLDIAPSAVTAGATMAAVKVSVQDKFGNVVTSDRSKASIAIASGPVGATLGAAVTARTASGKTTFSKIVLNKAGNYTFKVTDAKLPVAASGPIVCSPSTATKIVIVSGPAAGAKVVAGAKVAPIVAQVQDKFGNVVTTDSSVVSASIAGGGELSGTATATAVKGIATFSNLQILHTFDYALKLTDGDLKSAKTNTFTVVPAAAAKLYVGASPADITAGDTIAPIGVFIFDQYNNQITTDASKVTVALTGAAGAKLTGTTVVTAANGFAGFTDLSTTMAGTDKLTFTDGKLTAAVTDTFDVSADAAAKVVFGTAPVGGKAGATMTTFTAKIEDQFGNVVTDDTSDVSIEPVTAPFAPDDFGGTTTQTAEAGVATFDDLSLTTAGIYGLKVSAGELTDSAVVPITITPGVATKLAIVTGPADAVAGVAFPAMSVQVQDAYDNVVTTDASKITAAIVSGTGTSGAALTGVAAVAAAKGVATFNGVNITTAGEGYTVKFTDGSLTTDTSDAFDITAAAAAKLVFGQAPSAAVTGAEITPDITVKIEDKFGNVCTDNTSNVTIATGTTVAGAVLGGTLTVAAEDGIATFDDLTLDKAGSYTLKASDGSLTVVISPAIKITAASASSKK